MHFMKAVKKTFLVETVSDDPDRDSYARENIFLCVHRARACWEAIADLWYKMHNPKEIMTEQIRCTCTRVLAGKAECEADRIQFASRKKPASPSRHSRLPEGREGPVMLQQGWRRPLNPHVPENGLHRPQAQRAGSLHWFHCSRVPPIALIGPAAGDRHQSV